MFQWRQLPIHVERELRLASFPPRHRNNIYQVNFVYHGNPSADADQNNQWGILLLARVEFGWSQHNGLAVIFRRPATAVSSFFNVPTRYSVVQHRTTEYVRTITAALMPNDESFRGPCHNGSLITLWNLSFLFISPLRKNNGSGREYHGEAAWPHRSRRVGEPHRIDIYSPRASAISFMRQRNMAPWAMNEKEGDERLF